MKTQLKIFALFTILLLYSCKENSDKGSKKNVADNEFLKTLVERQIGKSNYYISLPKDYVIEETNGEDFSVYHFHPADSTKKEDFSGGFYFGNHPSQFPPDNKSCTTENKKNRILAQNSNWTVYNCNGNYAIQTIIDSKSGENWNELLHLFGNAQSNKNLNNLLFIFTTMKK